MSATTAGTAVRVMLIDSNVLFSRRLGDALRREGLEVVHASQSAYALTMLEWNTPAAILCATNLREMGALEIAPLLRADPKTAQIPLVAISSGDSAALMEAFRAGCDECVDRRRPPEEIASHIRNMLLSRQEGFQPTQMLPGSETSLSGNIEHHDVTSVLQMLNQARQTGALHINSSGGSGGASGSGGADGAAGVDGIIFFDAGEMTHAECDTLFGDEAVIHILKACQKAPSGVYKFSYGAPALHRTVLRSATELMLDAMREFDEGERDQAEQESHEEKQ
jgi:two-component system, cell cycle response regulator DivK